MQTTSPSTYDLEDCLKAGFLTPASILATPDNVLQQVADKVSSELGRPFLTVDVLNVLVDIFENITSPRNGKPEEGDDLNPVVAFVERSRASHDLASDGGLRTKLSSQLVTEGIEAVDAAVNEEFPPLSIARLASSSHAKVEVLKQYTYITTIFSSRVSIPEFRGYEVVEKVFKALSGPRGYLLMPDDVRSLYMACEGDLDTQMRIVCDFVAGMTDRYAMEFYGRLHSDTAQSMFKPV